MCVRERERDGGEGNRLVQWGQRCCRGDFRGESDRREQQSGRSYKEDNTEQRTGQQQTNLMMEKMIIGMKVREKKGCLARDWENCTLQNNTVSYVSAYSDRWTNQIHTTNPTALPPALLLDQLHRVRSLGSGSKECVCVCVCVALNLTKTYEALKQLIKQTLTQGWGKIFWFHCKVML